MPDYPFGVLSLALVGAAIALTSCGGSDAPEEEAPLTQTERVRQAQAGTVSITGETSQVVDEAGNTETVESGGTGVVIDAREGLVLTNAHVVTGLKSIRAKVAGTETAARLHGQAPCQDLAVIKLTTPPTGMEELQLGNSETVKAGQHVTAVGFPGDLGESEDFAERAYSATEGAVSVPKTQVQSAGDIPRLPAVIRHQVPISGGNSGGPLINDKGEVVGINTLSGDAEEANVQSQNISIASNHVKSILPDLVAGQDIAYVGWDLTTAGQEGNVVVVEAVDTGSSADRSNFNPSDVILEVEGQSVDNKGDICDIVESKEPGDIMAVAGLEAPYEAANAYNDIRVRIKGPE